LRRNKEFERLWSALEEELKSLNLNERMTLALADAAVGFRVRNSSYRKNADISDQVAGKDLRTLVDYGLLVPKGDRKWRSYVASDRLLQLRAKTRDREKLRTDPFALGLDRSGQPAQSSLPGLANGG
jgi:hypothetical protein